MNNYIPAYHFTPPSGWMNDPNGLVYYNGEYHMFYQALWPRHWGHAVSTDLVHWTHLPIALAPDDLGGIWSGSAVVDTDNTSGFFEGEGGLVAIFTHEKEGKQSQSIAFSHDDGRTWTKYAGNPVIPSIDGLFDFRDPKVFWHAPTNSWVMVLATWDSAMFYASPDLKNWTRTGQFGKGHGLPNVVWECPDLFPLPVDGDTENVKWVLNSSYFAREATVEAFPECLMQYFIGEFDGSTFHSDYPADTVLRSTGGIDDYAAVTWANMPDGRLIWIGWMSQWEYGHKVPTDGWQGAMTVPRVVSLQTVGGQPRIVQTPVEELKKLRGEPVSSQVCRPVGPGKLLGLGTLRNAFEIVAEFEPGTAEEIGILLKHGEGDCQTLIGCDIMNGTVFIDRTQTGGPDVAPEFSLRRTAALPASGRIKLHIFVDAYSVELFANDGVTYMACQIFPEAESSEIQIYANGGDAMLSGIEIFPLAA